MTYIVHARAYTYYTLTVEADSPREALLQATHDTGSVWNADGSDPYGEGELEYIAVTVPGSAEEYGEEWVTEQFQLDA